MDIIKSLSFSSSESPHLSMADLFAASALVRKILSDGMRRELESAGVLSEIQTKLLDQVKSQMETIATQMERATNAANIASAISGIASALVMGAICSGAGVSPLMSGAAALTTVISGIYQIVNADTLSKIASQQSEVNKDKAQVQAIQGENQYGTSQVGGIMETNASLSQAINKLVRALGSAMQFVANKLQQAKN